MSQNNRVKILKNPNPHKADSQGNNSKEGSSKETVALEKEEIPGLNKFSPLGVGV
jgi:hypothetical protein